MAAVTLQAITVIGRDRPGIIAETTRILAELGFNIEDSTMTLLRGHFAMMLICAGQRSSAEVQEALGALTEDGTLDVAVREVPEEPEHPAVGSTYVLSVHGGDRAGIVSRVVGEVARLGGNITDLTTRLAGDLYVLVAEVDLPARCDVEALQTALRRAGDELGVDVALRRMESDEL
ncbi:MAG TPA: ACT domain-containing protein [Nocardioidaceae bacterium]